MKPHIYRKGGFWYVKLGAGSALPGQGQFTDACRWALREWLRRQPWRKMYQAVQYQD